MQGSIIQNIKQKAGRLLEQGRLVDGTVLAVRVWDSSSIIEIDLHLPDTNMDSWQDVPYIKFRIAALTYRDYTPSGWDADIRTCTVFIDVSHQGAGSVWAQALKTGDLVQYLKIGTTRQSPLANSQVIALGDQSSIGHLLALRLLAPKKQGCSGAILFSHKQDRRLFKSYFPSSGIEPVDGNDEHGHRQLLDWVSEQPVDMAETIFFVAGNARMVSQVRTGLKELGCRSDQIKTQGFWN